MHVNEMEGNQMSGDQENDLEINDNDGFVHLRVKIIKNTQTKHFPGKNGDFDDFEAMSLVNPLDQRQWSRFLYQYITMYNIRFFIKKPGILLKKSYNWEEAARKTLELFDRLLRRIS